MAEFAGRFVPLKIVTQQENKEWQTWARKYKYEGRGIPILFVIRSDGEQLYGQSGSLPGDKLPEMLASVLQQAGLPINEEQFNVLEEFNKTAEAALAESDLLAAARAIKPLTELGTPTQLGSYAEPAIRADELSTIIQQQGLDVIQEARGKLDDTGSAFSSLVTLSEIDATLGILPQVAQQMNEQKREWKQNKQLRDLIKPAQAIVRARHLAASSKRRDRKNAEKAYAGIISRYQGSSAAALAEEELSKLNPEAVVQTQQAETRPAFRTWSDKSGAFSVQARFVRIESGTVFLEKESGGIIEVKVDRFSTADREYLKNRQ